MQTTRADLVSIRRADYWLDEVKQILLDDELLARFNPPGGLLVG